MSPVSSLSTEWRIALLCGAIGGAIGVALTIPEMMTEQNGVGLLLAGLVAGYLAPTDADAYAAGGRAGFVAMVPLTAWFVFVNADWFAANPIAFAVAAGLLLVAFTLGFGYFVGGLSAGVGGWLAVQFGKKEPA